MGDAGVEYEFPHVSGGWYRAIVFCSEALNMDVATAAMRREFRVTGPDWFTVSMEENGQRPWSLDAQRRVVQGDEYAANLLEIVRNDPTKLSDGEFAVDAMYSHCWYIFGTEDPDMDYFNDWLGGTQRVHMADPGAIWVDLACLD